MTLDRSEAIRVADRIDAAINAHDLDALVDCFTAEYRSRQPVHPDRDFDGAAQVRNNWARILDAVPDLRSEIVRLAVEGDTAWVEWDWQGTRRDLQQHRMRGVTILGIDAGRVAWSHFYMEPVVPDGVAIDRSVEGLVGAAAAER